MKNRGKYMKKRKKPILPIALVCVLVLGVITGGTIARYLKQIDTGYRQADAPEFYFTSDLLGEDDQNIPTYAQVCSSLKDAEINFQLRNFKDELNKSGVDIEYMVSYKTADMADYTELKSAAGTIRKSSDGTSDISIELSDMGITSGTSTTVYIKVEAGPYTKVLYGCFQITESRASGITWSVADAANTNALTLTVTVASGSGTVTVNYPSDCRYDVTDTRLTGGSGNTVTFTANEQGSYSFVFFKTASSRNYSGNGTASGNTVTFG